MKPALLKAVVGCFLAAALLPGADAGSVDFQRQIRPVLSDNCFACHGPDAGTRMADLRLDVREGAFQQRPNGAPIITGDPEKSLLFQRINEADAARRMPPAYSHKKLTPEQIALIRRWIEEGASWSEHWAFVNPTRPAPPAISGERWGRNPIDAFILARLEREGIKPEPEADRGTLIRRASLDLTGLPPDSKDVEAFVADSSPDAYERIVDRLLQSPAYGEHRARYWLDAARYADTHGLHIDNYREMWPYRDWVIEAFNRNLPFDQFTVEQLAGDLLPNATREQLIATGFHRCNITTNEGGVIEEEVAVMYAKDRVDTTGTVWLGLTVGCATCHDHKFDPIRQRDFYSLAAFFRNTTQDPMDGNIFDPPPVIVVASDADRARWDALREEIPAAQAEIQQSRIAAEPEFEKWLGSRERRSLAGLERFDDSETFRLEIDRRAALPNGVRRSKKPQPATPALTFLDEGSLELSGAPELSAGKPFTISLRFLSRGEGGTLVSQHEANEENRGWRVEISAAGRPRLLLVAEDRYDLGINATGDRKAQKGRWHHLVASYDGKRQRAGMQLYLDGQLLPSQSVGRTIRSLEGDFRNTAPMLLGARINNEGEKAGFFNGAMAEFRILERPVTAFEARLLASWDGVAYGMPRKTGKLSRYEREALAQYYLARVYPPARHPIEQAAKLEEEQRALLRRNPFTHVMHEQPDSEPVAHILNRGMYDQPGEEVPPATPAVLPPMPESLPRNRLGLARWLVNDANPLTARVTVNRSWQEVFGAGLVRSAGDFGSQGQPPTHPELLDWLAVEFRESGWDVKKLFRLMVTSAAYRQASAVTPEKLEKDPDNRLLSRGPRFRMDGEMVRDYALSTSGLLQHKIGGPSVKPYQPERIWQTVAMEQSNTRVYEPDSGESLYRRSLYTFWKRAAPPPSMMVFNAPTREECTVQRERTNTPLQALVTMNDPQFFEAARVLAGNVMRSGDEFGARLDAMTLRLLSRRLNDRERRVVEESYRDYLRYYDSHPDEARRATEVGGSKPDSKLDTVQLAAFTMVANQLMNLDEVLNK
jgi:mono/diheme cytochrome c family protein